MDINMDKIESLLERVTAGGAGIIDIQYHHHNKSCTITWRRPMGLTEHESYRSRAEILLYVRNLLADVGLWVDIHMKVTREVFLPEDC